MSDEQRGGVIHAEDLFLKKRTERLTDALKAQYQISDENIRTFAELARSDITNAIRSLPEFIKANRNAAPDRAFVEASAGGPNPDLIIPLLNIVGEVYRDLPREARETFLRSSLDFLDRQNYTRAQAYVEGMTSGSLAADIIASRGGLYWPGYQKAEGLVTGWKNIADAEKTKPEDLRSFLTCFVVAKNATGVPLPVRTWYYAAYPDVVEGTLDFIASRAAFETNDDFPISEFLNEYDPALHERIAKHLELQNWIALPR